MMLISILRYSGKNIFEFYFSNSKIGWSFIVTFVLYSALFSGIVSLLFAFTGNALYNYTNFSSESFLDKLSLNPVAYINFSSVISAVFILNLSLLALIFHKTIDGKEAFPKKLKQIFVNIPASVFESYVIGLLGLLIVYMLFYFPLFKSYISPDGIIGDSRDFFTHDKLSQFFEWMNSILYLFLNYLPYLLAIRIVGKGIGLENIYKNFRTHKFQVFSVLILSFTSQTVIYTFLEYCRVYILNLLTIPFADFALPSIIFYVFFIIILTYLIPVSALSLLYPLRYKNPQIKCGM